MLPMRSTVRRRRVLAVRKAADPKVKAAVLKLLDRRFKSLKRELRQANLRKRLAKSEGMYKADEESWQDWIDNFSGAIEDAVSIGINDLFGVEFEYFGSRGKPVFEFDPQEVIRNYQIRTGLKIKNIGQDTLDDTQKKIADWYNTELGLKDLIEQLSALYGDDRAELIAITEMNFATSEVFLETMKNYGITTWLWDAGPDACDECLEKAAGSPYRVGDEMPPAHPHCYCSEAYADDDGEMI